MPRGISCTGGCREQANDQQIWCRMYSHYYQLSCKIPYLSSAEKLFNTILYIIQNKKKSQLKESKDKWLQLLFGYKKN